MVPSGDIRLRRVDFGWFVRPGSETTTGIARVEPVLGYLVRHPQGTLLVDTGMGSHPEIDAHYRPRRVSLDASLAAVDATPAAVDVVVNCHLHFDHCGGNPALAGRPVVVQSLELDAARTPDYTLPDLVDDDRIRYDVVDGEAEVWPGVLVLPTPGHTSGHQSVVVRRRDGTVVVIAGQSHDAASDYAAEALALRAADSDPSIAVPAPPGWMSRLRDLDPARVYFAHDHSVWTPN
jgi:N-acyl homoserine lactone hydrolase